MHRSKILLECYEIVIVCFVYWCLMVFLSYRITRLSDPPEVAIAIILGYYIQKEILILPSKYPMNYF